MPGYTEDWSRFPAVTFELYSLLTLCSMRCYDSAVFMAHIALWLNVITFALLASSIGLSMILNGRRTLPWMSYYIVYAAAYCLWIILYSIHFFAAIYLEPDVPTLNIITVYARLIISAAVAFSLPMTVLSAARKGGKRIDILVSLTGAVFVIVLACINLLTPSIRFASIINVLYNLYLCSFCLYGILRSQGKKQYPGKQIALPFFIFSGIFYPAAIAAGIILAVLEIGSLYVSSFAIAAYCLPWSILMIGRQSSYILSGAQSRTIPGTFLSDFGITPREKEIVEKLLAGKTNNQIARETFISLKTVETHIYNIYRKCGITKKMELNNLINTYR